jgi:hypothetical protein
VDNEIFESFEALDSDDEANNQKPRIKQFMIKNFATASGLTARPSKPASGPATKVQEGDAASLFSQSMMQSKKADSSDKSDDTPKMINRSPPTAQSEALSILSEGISFDLKEQLEQKTSALLQLTTMIPNNPENQGQFFLSHKVLAARVTQLIPGPLDLGRCSRKSSRRRINRAIILDVH